MRNKKSSRHCQMSEVQSYALVLDPLYPLTEREYKAVATLLPIREHQAASRTILTSSSNGHVSPLPDQGSASATGRFPTSAGVRGAQVLRGTSLPLQGSGERKCCRALPYLGSARSPLLPRLKNTTYLLPLSPLPMEVTSVPSTQGGTLL